MAKIIPPRVRAAMLRGDYKALSQMGRKGGMQNRSNRAKRTKRRIAIMEMEMQAMRYQALEHLSDPNRESVEYSKVITSA
jgi:hypothetical protein